MQELTFRNEVWRGRFLRVLTRLSIEGRLAAE
jgi:hypothetical protein